MSAEAGLQRHLAGGSDAAALARFEEIYRANVGSLTSFFARRCPEPQTVADLVSETFVEAMTSWRTFDPARGSAPAWLFGIARRVHARYCEQVVNRRDATSRLAGRRALDEDEIEELAAKIDAQKAGRELLARCAGLPEVGRTALELVDLAGLTPTAAAAALGVSPGVLRVRLFRARARLRKGADR